MKKTSSTKLTKDVLQWGTHTMSTQQPKSTRVLLCSLSGFYWGRISLQEKGNHTSWCKVPQGLLSRPVEHHSSWGQQGEAIKQLEDGITRLMNGEDDGSSLFRHPSWKWENNESLNIWNVHFLAAKLIPAFRSFISSSTWFSLTNFPSPVISLRVRGHKSNVLMKYEDFWKCVPWTV